MFFLIRQRIRILLRVEILWFHCGLLALVGANLLCIIFFKRRRIDPDNSNIAC